MNGNHSSARATYQPTIIESRLLIRRLAIQIAFLNYELKRGWIDFKKNPIAFSTRSTRSFVRRLTRLLSAPNVSAVVAVTVVVIMVLTVERATLTREEPNADLPPPEIVLLDVTKPPDSAGESRIGKDG